MERRDFLRATGSAAAGLALGCGPDEPRWDASAIRKPDRSRVAVLSAADYVRPLEDTLLRGLRLFRLDVRGRRVVLKPNMVEYDPHGVVNTHPAVVGAAVEAFRSLGAREVVVAEAPGHRRDTEYLLSASGLGEVLETLGAPYVDLNLDAVRPLRLASRFTELGSLYLPRTVLDADLLVSMPKMKTHHWAGITMSMKNLFGIVPGAVYGWPKNRLHWEGIEESILDINAALRVPRFNLVDGIVGMEGNGPIQGERVESGVLVLGGDPVAVDATCARLMSIEPSRVEYLETAAAFLGNLSEARIDQVGEDPAAHRRDYALIESFEKLRETRTSGS